MRPDEAAPVPSFSRHETFHLRYGWLKKGYDAIAKDPHAFVRDDATVRLGVGKNMVRSIRFWGLAAKMYTADKKTRAVAPTAMGRALLDDEAGLDPYLERPDTLWILHWLVFAPPCLLPAWWVLVNDALAGSVVAGTDDMRRRVRDAVASVDRWRRPSPRSVDKDFDVFVHTYSSRRGRDMVEDYLDCPFRSLHILRQGTRDEMRFVQGPKPGLSPLAAAFACLDFADRSGSAGRTATVHRLAMEAGSPGRALRLDEADMADLLAEAAEACDAIAVRNVNGAPSLSFGDGAEAAREEVLRAMYGRQWRERAGGKAGKRKGKRRAQSTLLLEAEAA